MATSRPQPQQDRRAPQALIVGLALLPFLALCALTFAYAQDAPFWMDWYLADLVDKAFSGALTCADLWRQHSDHRIFFPNLVLVSLARITHWDTRWEVVLNISAAASLLLVVARRSAAWTWPLLSVLAFSLAQWSNWLVGMQFCIFFCVLASATALILAAESGLSWPRLAAAAGCGALASYSFTAGTLVWPVGFVLIAAAPRPGRLRARFLAAWSLTAVAVMVLYLRGWEWLPRPTFVETASRFGRLCDALVLLGSPLCDYYRPGALICGAFGLAFAAWGGLKVSRGSTNASAFPGIAAWSAGTALLIGLGRQGLGEGQFLSSHYVTLAVPLWLADVALLGRLSSMSARRGGRWRAAAAVLAAAALANSVHGSLGFVYRGGQQQLWREELLAGGELQGLAARWPDRRILSARLVPILLRHRLSCFRGEAPPAPPWPTTISVSPGAVDGSVRRVALPNGRAAYRGWAAGADGEPAERIIFVRGTQPVAITRPFIPMLRLALDRRKASLLWSGFEGVFEEPPDQPPLRVVAAARGGASELEVEAP